MVSQTFSLGEEGRKGICTKIILLLLLAAIVAVAIIAGIFAFRSSSFSSSHGCESPRLDQNGLSNFTSGAQTIVFSCFPGFFVDQTSQEGSNMLISQCKDNTWDPEPPTCNYLPLRLDCEVTEHGLHGNITMVQRTLDEPTTIVGLVNFSQVFQSPGHMNELIHLSRMAPNCRESNYYNVTDEIEALKQNETSKNTIKIFFESGRLAAYRKAEVRIQMVYLDMNTIAAIISAHQGNTTLVMQKDELPKNGWNKFVNSKEKDSSDSSDDSGSSSDDSEIVFDEGKQVTNST